MKKKRNEEVTLGEFIRTVCLFFGFLGAVLLWPSSANHNEPNNPNDQVDYFVSEPNELGEPNELNELEGE